MRELEGCKGCLYCQDLEEIHVIVFQNLLTRTSPMALLNYKGVKECGQTHGCSWTLNVFVTGENNEISPSKKIGS